MSIGIQTLYLRFAQVDNWLPYSPVMPFYRAIADAYDVGAKVLLPDYDAAIDQLLNKLNLSENDSLLDVATGTGKVLLAAQSKIAWGMGIDLSPHMLMRLRQQSSTVPITLADARALPLLANRFTVATLSFMLLHLTAEEKQQVLNGMADVLRPHGRLGCLTSTEHITSIYPTREQWQQWLTRAGCEQIEFYEFRKIYRIVTGRLGTKKRQEN